MELGVFGLRGFDDVAVRANLYRIPQVSIRLNETQRALDNLRAKHIDLFSIVHDQRQFLSLTKEFRNFILSLFSLGLYEKHLRSNPMPDHFIINENLDLVIDYIKAELLQEKIAPRFIDNYVRAISKKGFVMPATSIASALAAAKDQPVSYSLCTSHARWLHKGEGTPAMSYGLFFQFLSQSIRENDVQKITYFGLENEEWVLLQKVVYDCWPNIEVKVSVDKSVTPTTTAQLFVAG